ncbi:MAG: FtsX-like permease family protein [Bowdeniella nasicola]|nr:FtsX-like permease family protein [Bowdeniella nasicola]
MNDVLFAQLRHKPGRMIATMIAIIISTIFVVLTLGFGRAMNVAVVNTLAATMKNADVVATCDSWNIAANRGESERMEMSEADLDQICIDIADEIAQLPEISLASVYETGVVDLKHGDNQVQAQIGSALPSELEYRVLAAGSMPRGANDIALSEVTAEALKVTVGDSVVVPGVRMGTEAPHDDTLTVTGITQSSDLFDASVTPAKAGDWASYWGVGTKILIKANGVSATDAQSAITDAHLIGNADPAALQVHTVDEELETAVEEFKAGSTVLTAVIGIFAAIAVIVAGIVIALTFQVLVVQRTRELAMLRCIGATTRQIKRLVLFEALLLGLIASVIGAIIAVIIAIFALPLLNVTASVDLLAIPVIVGIIVGLLVTLISAWAPSRRATKVAPLEALRPAELTSIRERAGKVRTGLAIVIMVLGLAGLGYGLAQTEVFIAMLSGIVFFVGVLLFVSVICPPLIRGLGRLLGGSAPAEMAVSNLARNPRRTASTVMALVLGIGLVSTVAVGKQSIETGILAEMDHARPIDVSVFASEISAAEREKIAAIDDVTGVWPVRGIAMHNEMSEDEASEFNMMVLAYDPDVNNHIRGQLTAVAPGACLSAEYEPNTHLTFSTPAGGHLECDTIVHRGITEGTVWMHPDDLADLPLADSAVVVQISDDLNPTEFTRLINKIEQVNGEFNVIAQAGDRITYTYVLTNLMYFILALLAASVVIAVVGVSNTLSLSVMERRQESGLLRALGFTRRDMKRMLTWEAILIATSALIIGLALGIFEAWAGARAVGGEMEVAMPLSIPWGWVISIIGGALLAAILASRFPARRAAKATPVQALVTD